MKFKNIAPRAKIFTLFLLLPVTFASFGQASNHLKFNSSNSITDAQMEYIRNQYSAKVEAPKEFINGKEYEPYYLRSKSKPLLLPNQQRTSSLFTKTRRYNNLTLQYDTFLDQVIYTDTSKTINYRFPQIALNDDIVEGFNLYFQNDSMVFKYLRMPECARENLKEGFYEIGYTGNSKYLIKHASSFYAKEGLNEYKYYRENFINTGNGFFKVKSKGSLLKLFGTRADEMKKYLHASRIKVKSANKDQFTAILKHFDSLLISSR